MDYTKMVKELVRKGYGEDDTEIVNSIINSYNKERVKYAYKNNMDIFDLDAWEYGCSLYEKGKLKEIIDLIELPLSKKLEEILTDGKFFLEISSQMWNHGYEFMEFENYNKESWLKLRYLLKNQKGEVKWI